MTKIAKEMYAYKRYFIYKYTGRRIKAIVWYLISKYYGR